MRPPVSGGRKLPPPDAGDGYETPTGNEQPGSGTVQPPANNAGTLGIATQSLPQGKTGKIYANFVAPVLIQSKNVGSSFSYWKVTSPLPIGMYLTVVKGACDAQQVCRADNNSALGLYGIPRKAGTYPLTVTLQDGVTLQEVQKQFSIIIKPALVQLLSPNGGETLTVGATETIRWTAPASIKTVNIYTGFCGYNTSDCGLAPTYNPIVLNAANTGSYAWTVVGPHPNAPSGRFVISITASGGSEEDLSDESFLVVK
jgi:hypothetical protein